MNRAKRPNTRRMRFHEASRGNQKIIFCFFDHDNGNREHQRCHESRNLRHSTLMGFWAKIPLLKFVKYNYLLNQITWYTRDGGSSRTNFQRTKGAPGPRQGSNGATVAYLLFKIPKLLEMQIHPYKSK